MRKRITIGIIGGGFCGAAAAIHLLRNVRVPIDLMIFEPRATLGAGLAYSTSEPDHRTNGPIDILSIFPNDIGHFPSWFIESGEAAADPGALASTGQFYCRRAAFGRYMTEMVRIHRATSNSVYCHVRSPVDDVYGEGDEYWVVAGGTSHRVDIALLCLGHEKPALPRELRPLAGHPRLLADPWAMDAIDAIPNDWNVILLGSGLTAVDVVASLFHRGHRGRIVAISRRGLLPRPQGVLPPVEGRLEKLFRAKPIFIERHGRPAKVRQILRAVRSDIERVREAGGSWQDAFDDLRDAAPHLWQGLSLMERRFALRHLQTWYDIHRFRMAPQLWELLQAARGRDQFRNLRARVADAAADRSGTVRLDIVRRDGALSLRTQAVINCTGPSADPSRSTNPLLQALLKRGLVSPHPTGVGLAVDDECRALDAGGRPQPNLRVLGVLSRGHVGDLIAVPQINGQVRNVLSALADLQEKGHAFDI